MFGQLMPGSCACMHESLGKESRYGSACTGKGNWLGYCDSTFLASGEMTALDIWYREERDALATLDLPNGGLMLGGLIYGPLFLGIFANYCLATILSRANREALQGATIAFYTDEESRAPLSEILRKATDAGLRVITRIIPADVMALGDGDSFWNRVATAQSLLVQMAAHAGSAFHALMPDQVYSEHFFPNMLRLANGSRNIVHNGLNAKLSCASDLQRYRQSDGSLTVPARKLNDIAWDHLHWRMNCFVMNDAEPGRWYNTHYMLWKARDRALMFGPNNSLSFIRPDVCKLMIDENRHHPSGTLDTKVQGLVGTDYIVPAAEDDMTLIGFEWTGQPDHPVDNYAKTVEEYIDFWWTRIRYKDEWLGYYSQPMAVIATSIDESAPPVEEVMARQQGIVDMLIANKAASAERTGFK